MRVNAMLAAAGFALALAAPAGAAVERDDGDRAAIHYVRARAADAAGKLDVAAAGYAAALAASPNDERVALRAYRQAIVAGDQPLARRAVQVLEAGGMLPADARLFLLAEAVQARDWSAAAAETAAIERDDVFAFLAPVIRGWIAFGAGEPDPVARLADVGKGGSLAIAYAGEQRALLMLAAGQSRDAIAAIRAATPSGGRAGRLRLAGAAKLAKDGDRAGALALLGSGDDQGLLRTARERLAHDGRLPGAIDTPAAGIAELLVRVASDVSRERVTPLSLTLARIATFLAPDNAETWVATADMLAAADHTDAALAALARVDDGALLSESVRLARLQLLVRKGEQQAALNEAQRAAAAPEASLAVLSRVGDLLGDLDRHRESAEAYGRALALAERDPALAGSRWTVLMLRGGALDAAGDWQAARADLQRAARLAPDEPVILNYLGYAQLERRENLAQAEKLIEKASALKPDDAAITDSLGWTYYLRGDVPKAITTLERAVAGEPGEPTINEHLGDAYWSAGRRYEARYAWRAALVYADAKIAERLRSKLDGGLSTASAAP